MVRPRSVIEIRTSKEGGKHDRIHTQNTTKTSRPKTANSNKLPQKNTTSKKPEHNYTNKHHEKKSQSVLKKNPYNSFPTTHPRKNPTLQMKKRVI